MTVDDRWARHHELPTIDDVLAKPADTTPRELAWCSACNGTGVVDELGTIAGHGSTWECPDCRGSGVIDTESRRPVDLAGLTGLVLDLAKPDPRIQSLDGVLGTPTTGVGFLELRRRIHQCRAILRGEQ